MDFRSELDERLMEQVASIPAPTQAYMPWTTGVQPHFSNTQPYDPSSWQSYLMQSLQQSKPKKKEEGEKK